ncbi:MAG TPA: TIGR01458 family HAD-type hydrolase [Gemmatimonadales bacterium]|nr:TIGR01458 family HAD-type hydrolase [Gemmatimonadales bacterium]
MTPDRLHAVRGVLLDLDGTLYEDDRPIPGAVDAVRAVRGAGRAVRFVTNTSRRPRRDVLARLEAMGFAATHEELITAPVAAARWLLDAGLRRVALCLPDATLEDFEGLEPDLDHPEAVVVGDLGADWTYDLLTHAFGWLMDGAQLVAIQKNRYWRTAGGLALDAGPFVAALEFAAGVEATIVGKPSAAFFTAAAGSAGLRCEDVLMVGDDVRGDVAGAQAAGCLGALVRTGKFRPDDVRAHRPDLVLDGVAALPAALGIADAEP